MDDLKLLPDAEPSTPIGVYAIHLGLALLFVSAGYEKFPSGPDANWVTFFDQVGIGTWFRYFTGVVEILGALLLLIPRTALWGTAFLACTMACATIIVALVLHRPGESVFPGLIFAGLALFGWNQWKPAS